MATAAGVTWIALKQEKKRMQYSIEILWHSDIELDFLFRCDNAICMSRLSEMQISPKSSGSAPRRWLPYQVEKCFII